MGLRNYPDAVTDLASLDIHVDKMQVDCCDLDRCGEELLPVQDFLTFPQKILLSGSSTSSYSTTLTIRP